MLTWIAVGLCVAIIDYVISQARHSYIFEELGIDLKYCIFPTVIYATIGYLAIPFYIAGLFKSWNMDEEELKELLSKGKDQQDMLFNWRD